MSIDLEIAAPPHSGRSRRSPRRPASVDALEPYGKYKAKIGLDFVARVRLDRPLGKLVLVTGINPTPNATGQGRTTTTVSLGDALNHGLGKRAMICRRDLAWREGGGGRQPCAGGADGGHQPPFHRRFPCDHGGQQPARRHARYVYWDDAISPKVSAI